MSTNGERITYSKEQVDNWKIKTRLHSVKSILSCTGNGVFVLSQKKTSGKHFKKVIY